ncbi:WXG100 family type VII secretion target [Streptomyces boncukensis]|uniref:ESAT-6-like protein n=1 Tax=Streptomyces boncukensis TaxID=2711219 RepID=A0A6G4X9J3_9ACTN|nr:WXG100 family type VII secretion target [Streptomyces boncukensis]NGO73832.1 WXG100 family type VII secretion target [Streptomyces boncukensis]
MAEDPLNSLKVNYAHLDDIAEQIRVRRTLLEQQMEAAWREVKKVDQAWQGEAKEMFNAIDKQWHARATEIKEQLQKIQTLVQEGRGNYRATDLKAASLFQQLG